MEILEREVLWRYYAMIQIAKLVFRAKEVANIIEVVKIVWIGFHKH